MDAPKAKFNFWMVSTFVLLGVIIGFVGSKLPFLNGSAQQASVLKPAANAPSAPSAPKATVLTADQIAALPDDDPVFGDANAPVTIVEFSDFQCGYCARFMKNTLPLIEENYIKTGKAKFVYRDFPLDIHPQAMPAAEAAECADEQGKFREMHDILFTEQSQWSGNPDAEKLMKDYAKKIGLDAKKFADCVSKETYASEIRKDLVDGATVGINGTPGFFINGKELSGAMPYESVFKPIIDAELAGKKWEVQFSPQGQPSVKVE